MNTNQFPQVPQGTPIIPAPKRKSRKPAVYGTLGALAGILVGGSLVVAGGGGSVEAEPKPAVTITAEPSPAATVTVTETAKPEPAVTVTAQPEPAPTVTVTAQPAPAPTVTVQADPPVDVAEISDDEFLAQVRDKDALLYAASDQDIMDLATNTCLMLLSGGSMDEADAIIMENSEGNADFYKALRVVLDEAVDVYCPSMK